MRISDWSSDVCSSDLAGAWTRFGPVDLCDEIGLLGWVEPESPCRDGARQLPEDMLGGPLPHERPELLRSVGGSDGTECRVAGGISHEAGPCKFAPFHTGVQSDRKSGVQGRCGSGGVVLEGRGN